MLDSIMTGRLLVGPNPPQLVLLFFTYSFLGYVLECVVLTLDTKKLVINRGFAMHLPFCIIYGFGALLGCALLWPLKSHMVLLFFVGAFIATVFEYLVARLQMRLFGSFWWNYEHKPFNYKGILCLESTLAWGVVAVTVICFLHSILAHLVRMVPGFLAAPLAVLLVVVYAADFAFSAYDARGNRHQNGHEARRFFR